jgi:hypothetical protein
VAHECHQWHDVIRSVNHLARYFQHLFGVSNFSELSLLFEKYKKQETKNKKQKTKNKKQETRNKTKTNNRTNESLDMVAPMALNSGTSLSIAINFGGKTVSNIRVPARGAIQLTMMLCSAPSFASVCVSPIIPIFAVL